MRGAYKLKWHQVITVIIVACVCLLGLTGCGSGAAITAAGTDGTKLFAAAGCSGCHALSAANATGTSGPNLDDLKPDQAAVENQVKNGGGGMPAFESQLAPTQIAALAAFVAESAGR